jgi:hypothetical protein
MIRHLNELPRIPVLGPFERFRAISFCRKQSNYPRVIHQILAKWPRTIMCFRVTPAGNNAMFKCTRS